MCRHSVIGSDQHGHYVRAAGQGSAPSQRLLGLCYLQGVGTAVDEAKARAWLRSAAEQGLPEAQYELGVMVHEGKGAPADVDQAYRWVRKAADAGLPVAMLGVGLAHLKGWGVEPDEAEAFRWYQRAAASLAACIRSRCCSSSGGRRSLRVTPARAASMRSASPNSTPSLRITNEKTSVPVPEAPSR